MDIINKEINDVLDSQCKKKNFINNKKYSDEYKKNVSKWANLPMYLDKVFIKKFFNLIHKNNVILLKSSTGTGKTVLIPKYVYKYFKSTKNKLKIAVTNPKTLITKNNADFSALLADVKLGQEIGYKYKGSPEEASCDDTQLIFMTDGTLSSMITHDHLLKQYGCIIIDEAHERNPNIDILILQLREIVLERHNDFKIIIMSATINSEIFEQYFKIEGIKYGDIEKSLNTNYDIKQIFMNNVKGNYVDNAVDKCLDIIEHDDNKGDIIVFVATSKEAIKGCDMIKVKCPNIVKIEECNKLYCVSFYSKMKHENKILATDKNKYKENGFTRKIIFATNLAESSITFDGIVYVIDSGYELKNFYNANTDTNVIVKQYTSQAQILQRIGRSGRTQPGIAYHLYNKPTFNTLKKYPDPEILVIDITEYFLRFMVQYKTISKTIEFINKLITIPHIEQSISAIYKLNFFNCIKLVKLDDTHINYNNIEWKLISNYKLLSNINGAVTSVGYNILKFKSISLLSSYTILISHYLKCVDDIIIIIAILEHTSGNLDRLFKIFDRNELIKYFSDDAVEDSDHLTILNVYKNKYMKNNKTFLNMKEFDEIKKSISSLHNQFNKISNDDFYKINEKYKIITEFKFDNNILACIKYGHYYNLLKKENDKVYSTINHHNNISATLKFSPITPLSKQNKEYVFYSSIDALGKKNFLGITYT